MTDTLRREGTESAARSAEWAAESAESAEWAARSAAWSAARSARSAESDEPPALCARIFLEAYEAVTE